MKNSIFKVTLLLALLGGNELLAGSSKKVDSALKEYYFFQNDHSQLSINLLANEGAKLNSLMQSLGERFKSAEKTETLEDRLLVTAGVLNSWVSELVKDLNLNVAINTEFGFLPKAYSKHLHSNSNAAFEKIMAGLKANSKFKNYPDRELFLMAIKKMPIGYDSSMPTVDEFQLFNPWPSSQIEIIAGDVALQTVNGGLKVKSSIVLSLPKTVEVTQTNLGGYAVLEHINIPSKADGNSPIYAVLNLDLMVYPQDLQWFEDIDKFMTAVNYAALRVDFANRINVSSGIKINRNDFRMLTFNPVMSSSGFEESALTDSYLPTVKSPYLRFKNLLPKDKIWKPLTKIFGGGPLFDFGFVNLYGLELDLRTLNIQSLSGRIELYNAGEDKRTRSGWNCVSLNEKDHCLGLDINPGDYSERYLTGLINKSLDGQKKKLRDKIRAKVNDVLAISKGSYEALNIRNGSHGSYTEFSKNMIQDLCQDGILEATDEQCREFGQ